MHNNNMLVHVCTATHSWAMHNFLREPYTKEKDSKHSLSHISSWYLGTLLVNKKC